MAGELSANTAVSLNLSPYRTEPYTYQTYQTFKNDFSITNRQKLKVKLYSERARLTV